MHMDKIKGADLKASEPGGSSDTSYAQDWADEQDAMYGKANFVEENDKHITVSKPLALMATQQGMGLAPYAFTIPQDSKLQLNKSAVVFVCKTDPEMGKQYMTSTTGIQKCIYLLLLFFILSLLFFFTVFEEFFC